MLPVALPDSGGTELSGLDMYFLEEDGSTFKATLFYEPYFYLAVAEGKSAREIMIALKRRFDSHGMQIDFADKEDLDMPNHLSGNMRRFLKLRFASVSSLMEVKSALLPAITANRLRAEEASSALADFEEEAAAGSGPNRSSADDYLAAIVDIREYDVPYYVRCSIDNDIRVGAWYEVTPGGGGGSTVRELKVQ
jgi:DNA polymerase epsilon subunit 1